LTRESLFSSERNVVRTRCKREGERRSQTKRHAGKLRRCCFAEFFMSLWQAHSFNPFTRQRLLPDMPLRKLMCRLCTVIVLVTAPLTSFGQCVSGYPTKGVVPPVPYGFTLGKTTLAEAEAKWQAESSNILGRGTAAIGAGSGADGAARHSAEKIHLVDLASVELEGVRPARFAFFDGVLFSVQSVLNSYIDLKRAKNALALTEQEIDDFEKQVRQRYGSPSKACRDDSAGKKPDVLVWKYGDDTLTVITRGLRRQILYTNTALAKQAADYSKKSCRSVPGCVAR
jgi:hypothetical protein